MWRMQLWSRLWWFTPWGREQRRQEVLAAAARQQQAEYVAAIRRWDEWAHQHHYQEPNAKKPFRNQRCW